ncbi:4Fe-4S binding protein [Syntrophobotulus glycolicus]
MLFNFDIDKNNNWNYNECVQCGECINSCQVHALKRSWR